MADSLIIPFPFSSEKIFLWLNLNDLLCKNNIQDEKMLSTFRQLNDDNKDIILGEAKKALRDQRYKESVAADKSLGKTGTTNSEK